jgi:uncharacterized DUF497 family protein
MNETNIPKHGIDFNHIPEIFNGPTFLQLNKGWNAAPNAPVPKVQIVGQDVRCLCPLNAWAKY